MIRFCISLNRKLGRRDWTSLSKAFKLPSQSTLDKHKSVGSNDPDGFCHDIVDGESKKMDKVQANKSLSSEFKAWVCHGSLSYDSAKCPQPNVTTRSSTTSTLESSWDLRTMRSISISSKLSGSKHSRKPRQKEQQIKSQSRSL